MKMSAIMAATNTQSLPNLALHEKEEGKFGTKTVKDQTADPSSTMLSIGGAAAAAFTWASSKGIGAAAATHVLGAITYAKMAPVGIYAQYAAANAAQAAASAAVAGTSLGVAANCAVGLAVGGAVLAAGVIGYNTLVAKTPEEKISFGGMARLAYNKIFG